MSSCYRSEPDHLCLLCSGSVASESNICICVRHSVQTCTHANMNSCKYWTNKIKPSSPFDARSTAGGTFKEKSCCWNTTSRQRCPDIKGTHCTHSMYTYKCAEEFSRSVRGVWKAVRFDSYYQDYYCFSGPHRNPRPVGYMINLWANYHSTSSEASFLNCCAESNIEYQTWRVWPSLIWARLPRSPSPRSHALQTFSVLAAERTHTCLSHTALTDDT